MHAGAMTRHYTDSHPLVGPARQQYDFVAGLSNLVSGKGQCPMCQCKNLDVHKFPYAVTPIGRHIGPWDTSRAFPDHTTSQTPLDVHH